jgi:Zn-dependent protease with chaperone function
MDFFETQDRAHRNTKLLIAYFTFGVVLLVLAVYAVVVLVFAGSGHQWWHPKLFLGSAAATIAVVAIGSLYKTMELSRGGSAVAEMLGGRPVNPASLDPDERKLLNVVEEMALASGIPVPQVYILPQEKGINAFAAGHTTSDAVVAVTQGTLRLLSRDELQGVIAHEFSHILNGDMRMNLRLMGLIFGILCLAVIGRVLLQVRGGSKDKNPLPLLGLMLLLLGWIGFFFGRLIQAAVSRQREFLADASAVQFTRNPSGLAGALKKIGGLSYGSKLKNAQAGEASHMFFGNGMGSSFLGLMETHPPLAERIKALEPNFDGEFPRTILESTPQPSAQTQGIQPQYLATPTPTLHRPAVGAGTPQGIPSSAVIPNIGQLTSAQVRFANQLRDLMAPELEQAARDSLGACALLYGLLLSSEPATRASQLAMLSELSPQGIKEETERLLPLVTEMALRAKLPLLDLSLPGLRLMSPAQFKQFRGAIQRLIEMDGELDLFEYVLQKVVMRHLEPFFLPPGRTVCQYYALKPLAADCAVVLSTLAHAGNERPEDAQAAFQQGAGPLCYAARMELGLLPRENCGLDGFDAALTRFSQAAPQIKKSILSAAAQTAATDGVIMEIEAELLRAIADTLDCPIPPFLKSERTPGETAGSTLTQNTQS